MNKERMTQMNYQRAFVSHLNDICQERGIEIAAFSNDWIFCLRKGGRVTYVFGYDFGVNSAAAKMICKDKTATSDLLDFHGIPRIEHRIFHGPQLKGYVPMSGNWSAMLAFLGEHPKGLVCKPNEGTGGNAVYLARNAGELEAAVYQVFERSRSLCLSPFEEFEFEYRVALLFGEVQFIYRKVRPSIPGDGQQTLRELFLGMLAAAPDFAAHAAGLKGLEEMNVEWERIPSLGEKVPLNWRHNLGQGASPEFLGDKDPMREPVAALALEATRALGVELASVDIAATPNGLKVLEINSGIMMESLAKNHPDGAAISRRFYDRIVCACLGLS